MAKIFPSWDNIKKLKQSPTEGELYLLKYLEENLNEEIEIYFQPFLNGDRPDIILLQKHVGATIIEVKDWNLNSYFIDENNKWHLRKNSYELKSPFQQVFTYKANLFNLHINGLLEKKLKNPYFYNRISVYVYFHKTSKEKLEKFYEPVIKKYKEKINELNKKFKNQKIEYNLYINKLNYLNLKKSKIERDKKFSITYDTLYKIKLPEGQSNLFTDNIYKEFKRYLQPPYHTINQGIEIKYTKEQLKFIESKAIHEKIKGVAGSGKTTVLAKRVVNAHKRHNDTILILTYNISLKNYIRDKINEVKDNFNWKYFYITNYHQLILQTMNNLGIKIIIPDNIKKDTSKIEEYLEKNYFSNENLFKGSENRISKYKSIFIDEAQDYKSEWIKIIKKYFLEQKDSEMVLFGDERQNIFNRETYKNNLSIYGFGKWKYLRKPIRYNHKGDRILNLAKIFQKTFFKDNTLTNPIIESPSLALELYHISLYEKNKPEEITDKIYKKIREFNIHPNDIAILSSKIEILREIDFLIRKKYNEKTITTFETKEWYEKLKKEKDTKLQKELEIIRKSKKIHFNLNPGLIKLSTIHSFKGFEIPTLFFIIDENDNEELIYTAITRSKFNIMIFSPQGSKYNDFFYKHLTKIY